MKRVTPQEANDWKRLYEDRGLSIPAIAKLAKRNHHVVYYHLLRLGARIRTGQIGTEVTEAEVQNWAQKFLAGDTPEQFLQYEGSSRTAQTVYKHLVPHLKRMVLDLMGKEVIDSDET